MWLQGLLQDLNIYLHAAGGETMSLFSLGEPFYAPLRQGQQVSDSGLMQQVSHRAPWLEGKLS